MLYVPNALSTAPAIRGVAATFLALTTIVVAGRFWARILQKAHFGSDDWLVIPAWLFFVGLAACMLESTYLHTLGYTPTEAAPYHPDSHDGARIQLTINVFLALCLGFTKLSALQFYKRIFCIPKQPSVFRTILNVANVAIVLWIVAFIIFPLSECGSHLEGYWIRPVFNQYCAAAGHAYLIASSATDVFFELVVILMPIPNIWSLQTSVKRKTAITLVFLTAFLSLAASLARLVIVVQIAVNVVTDAGVAAHANSAVFNMWVLESGAGVLAVNMPSLWYFFTRKIPENALGSLRSIFSLSSLRSRISASRARREDSKGREQISEPKSMELSRKAPKNGVFGASASEGDETSNELPPTATRRAYHLEGFGADEGDVRGARRVAHGAEDV